MNKPEKEPERQGQGLEDDTDTADRSGDLKKFE